MNAEANLRTTPQMSDEQILASVARQSSVENVERSDKEDEGQAERMSQILKLQNLLKSACRAWKHRAMLTLFSLCSFEE